MEAFYFLQRFNYKFNFKIMKKYLSLLIVLLLVGTVGISAARAETSVSLDAQGEVKLDGSGGKMQELRKEMQDKKMELKAGFEAKRQEMKTKWESLRLEAKAKMEALKEKVKEEKDAAKAKIKELRITGRENALARFDVAISRMSTLSDKVSLHITNLKAKDIDVTAATAFVVTADAKLEAAKAKTVAVNELLSKSVDQLTAEEKTKLRTLTQETQALLQDARQALKEAVKALKEAVRIKIEAKAKVKAETSTEATTQ